MGFIDSYKRLEKLCAELFGNDKRITAYIDEMISLPDGEFYVKGWNKDLKMLKHCRWVRNRIVHDPGCTEENMCTEDDEKWIDDFYARIMRQTDPLSLYRKATVKSVPHKKAGRPFPEEIFDDDTEDSSSGKKGCLALTLASVVIAAVCIYLMYNFF